MPETIIFKWACAKGHKHQKPGKGICQGEHGPALKHKPDGPASYYCEAWHAWDPCGLPIDILLDEPVVCGIEPPKPPTKTCALCKKLANWTYPKPISIHFTVDRTQQVCRKCQTACLDMLGMLAWMEDPKTTDEAKSAYVQTCVRAVYDGCEPGKCQTCGKTVQPPGKGPGGLYCSDQCVYPY